MKQANFKKSLWNVMRRLFTILCVITISATAYAQRHQVGGTVLDSDGAPLPGTYVLIKGTTNGATTGLDGRYKLNAKPTDVLVFTFIGMKTHEENVGKRAVINVKMEYEANKLEDIIVIGYGTKTKTTLTGAVSALKGDELIKAPSTNISSMLGGRVTGLTSVQESGQPGEDQASLRIRGSQYGVTYIVDGMPRSINDIDPNNIESISVLKDAAAAAVYGLQSAGGVIIVTTKHGKVGENQITYDGSYGISRNANFPTFLNGPEYAYYYNKGLEMDGYQAIFTDDMVKMMTNGDDTDGWANTNWIKKIFGTGHNQKHTVTATGGNDNIKYFASLGYLGQDGNIKNFTYKRFNLRSNIDAQLAKNLKMSLGIAGQYGKRERPAFIAGGGEGGDGSDAWMSVARQTIAALPFLPTTYNGLPVGSPNRSGQGSSPIAATDLSGYNKNFSLDLQTTLNLVYSVPWVKGLDIKANGAWDHGYSYSKILSTPYYIMLATIPSISVPILSYSKSMDVRNVSYNELGEGTSRYTNMTGNLWLYYNHTFGDHYVDVTLVGEMRDNRSNNLAAYGKNLPFVELAELDFAEKADNPISGMSYHSRTAGYVGRISYDYAKKYFVELSGRYDASYNFNGMNGSRWGFFPAASLGWRMSQESWLKDIKWLDNLKLRASFGETGDDSVAPYKFLNLYSSTSPLYFNGNRYTTLYASSVANPYLTWERVRAYNVGFDATMFHEMLGIEFDVFYNYNYDILQSMGGNVPGSVGSYYKDVENYSKRDTKGFEIKLSHRNVLGSGSNAFKYSVELNLSHAYTRWLKYPDSPNEPDYQRLTGHQTGEMLGWIADGLYRSEEEIDNSPWPFGQRPRVGDIKYKDINGDGVVEYQDKVFTGHSNTPAIQGGLALNGAWKGFDVALLFTAAASFDVSLTGTYYNGNDDNTVYTETFKEGGNSPKWLVTGAWTEENPNAKYPRLTVSSPTNNNGLASTFWFKDGTYLRLKTAQIGYTIPSKILDYAKIKNLRIYIEGSNLFTLDKLPKGIDPESPGVNNGYYPQQRTFMCGITITL